MNEAESLERVRKTKLGLHPASFAELAKQL